MVQTRVFFPSKADFNANAALTVVLPTPPAPQQTMTRFSCTRSAMGPSLSLMALQAPTAKGSPAPRQARASAIASTNLGPSPGISGTR
jgi:hypothetical protein